jgi:hypothetical protein
LEDQGPGPLLAPISPSRLTEEIFKIVHSGRSAAIVALMDKLGLYAYLQPNAASRMKADPAFRSAYMASLAEMDAAAAKDEESPPGASSPTFCAITWTASSIGGAIPGELPVVPRRLPVLRPADESAAHRAGERGAPPLPRARRRG